MMIGDLIFAGFIGIVIGILLGVLWGVAIAHTNFEEKEELKRNDFD